MEKVFPGLGNVFESFDKVVIFQGGISAGESHGRIVYECVGEAGVSAAGW